MKSIKPDALISPLVQNLEAGHHYEAHSHDKAQLVFAGKGTMSVSTADGRWVVPDQQAVWVPADVEHEIHCLGALEMRSLYVHPKATKTFPDQCVVLNVSPLLREVILALSEYPLVQEGDGPGARLAGVLFDQLDGMEEAPLHLPLGRDPRLRRVIDVLVNDPSDRRGLDELGPLVGASGRTLARLFKAETGMAFSQWRRQLRLVEAITRLGDGKAVTEVAFELGYQSPSAFTAMFRRTLGYVPSVYSAKSSAQKIPPVPNPHLSAGPPARRTSELVQKGS